jgi:hypothetical protein
VATVEKCIFIHVEYECIKVAKLEGKLFDFYTFALSYDGFAVATPSLRGSAYGTWDVARVARRWSERSAELAPARAGVASRRPKG